MSLVELIVSFSLLRFVTDWRHENTEREKLFFQTMLESKRIESAERQVACQIELERQKEQFQTVRLIAQEQLLRKR